MEYISQYLLAEAEHNKCCGNEWFIIGNERLKGRVGGSEKKSTTNLTYELVQVVKLELAGKCEKPISLHHQSRTVEGKM